MSEGESLMVEKGLKGRTVKAQGEALGIKVNSK